MLVCSEKYTTKFSDGPTAPSAAAADASRISRNVAGLPAGDSSVSSMKGTLGERSKARPVGAQGGEETAGFEGVKPPLGIYAKYVDQLPAKPDPAQVARERRALAFKLQRTAAKLLPTERVRLCKWAVTSVAKGVDVNVTEAETGRRAHFGGLQSCGSVWHCPVCARKIGETRRAELNVLLAWARFAGLRPVMMTLTARHGIRDRLDLQLAAMKAAKRRLRQRREWRALKDRIAGTVTATEVTRGVNGWHTHFHEIILVIPTEEQLAQEKIEKARIQAIADPDERRDAWEVEDKRREIESVEPLQPLARAWRTCLLGFGLSGNRAAWQVQGAGAAGQYVAKWGAAEELAMTGAKAAKGKGMTPMQLLKAAEEGDEDAAAAWVVFAKVFKGARQLVWSDGLKKRAGIEEKPDEDAAEAEEQETPETLLTISRDSWRGGGGAWFGARYRRARILDAAETGGAEAAARAAYDGEDDDAPPDLIDMDDIPGRTEQPASSVWAYQCGHIGRRQNE